MHLIEKEIQHIFCVTKHVVEKINIAVCIVLCYRQFVVVNSDCPSLLIKGRVCLENSILNACSRDHNAETLMCWEIRVFGW